MKKRSYKVSIGEISAAATYFETELGGCRREPLGEVFDRISNFHSHTEFEVFYLLNGEMELVVEGDALRFFDSVVVIPAGMGHYTVANAEKLFVLYLHSENEENALWRGLRERILSFPLLTEERFYAEALLDRAADGDVYHLLSLLFSALARRVVPAFREQDLKRIEAGKYAFELDEYIQNHYSEPIKLADVAELLHLCERQVSRVIKKEYHCSFSELIKRKRLSVAAMMLKHTDLSVLRIAQKVGFENENYFFRVFKQKYGKTPNEYRNG